MKKFHHDYFLVVMPTDLSTGLYATVILAHYSLATKASGRNLIGSN